jgi:16S rRNA A1518/A1519 N6-dimethyltransferase RsmA/KsgA/DIM1 with predicted DNA glycosylase/AP lyase activity
VSHSPDLICALHCLLQEGKTAAGACTTRAKVVANLPFNLTKSMLRRLLPLGDHISELYLMVQVLMHLPQPRVGHS